MFLCANLSVIYLVFSLVTTSPQSEYGRRDGGLPDRREILAHRTTVHKDQKELAETVVDVEIVRATVVENNNDNNIIHSVDTSRKSSEKEEKSPQYLYDSSEDILDQVCYILILFLPNGQ